jgi:hypothetical protein
MNSLWNKMMKDHFAYRPRYTLIESINEAKRPKEGATRIMHETKTVKVKCEYPDPDDGASYSWVKVEDKDGSS